MRREDYTAAATEAARSVLLEVATLLGEYRQDIVVVGGWVPELLLAGTGAPLVGTIDVDLALNHRTLQDPGYETLLEKLTAAGYAQQTETRQPFRFIRQVARAGETYRVPVDLLAAEYGGRGKKHEHQKIQDVRARKARGCDLAFLMAVECRVEGRLPDGAGDAAVVRVADVVPYLVMKAAALRGRAKEKDALDIDISLQYYPGGLRAVVEKFRPWLHHGLVRECLETLADKFASPDHVGPVRIANLEELSDPDERSIRQRGAYERVDRLLRDLGVR